MIWSVRGDGNFPSKSEDGEQYQDSPKSENLFNSIFKSPNHLEWVTN